MTELFFELIRVAIGTQDSLLRLPSNKEWKVLFDMAKKQSLVGVCFAALQRLGADADEGFVRIGMSEMLYLKWMGMTAKIQQKNQTVDEQCVALQKRLSANGLRSCVLKGQGVASLYGEHLLGLRQSGDIDVWVDGGMEKAMRYAKSICSEVEFDYINAHLSVYEDTEVELHWRVSHMQDLCKNRKLQKWILEHKDALLAKKATLSNGEQITVPTIDFNAFYILLHIYDHEFAEGIGMRQLMDYYYVLRARNNASTSSAHAYNANLVTVFEQFGMQKFASGIMWIMREVFGLPEQLLICDANEREGRFLLNEIMQNGNFGHYDERIKNVGSGRMAYFWKSIQHNMHLAKHYPRVFFWQPIWLVYHFAWKRLWIRRHKELFNSKEK